MKKVRTRFAPSPTGYMHVGNLRTALYEYLIAKHNNGDFIVRIEDTDQERLVEGAIDIIYNTLDLCGFEIDESPKKGGSYGPYIQSERMDIYKEYAHKLVEMGKAYYCFCSEERLEELRKEAEKKKVAFLYDGCCKKLTEEQIEEKINNGNKYVIRQIIPEEGYTTYNDLVYGEITFENKLLEDQILLKSDGFPTYNFANVVDDHLMNITHVIRGNEYLSSTPKYNLLYEAFGWDPPLYIHVPPVMKDDSHKLSKRSGDASFHELVEKGYLPEAIINYLVLLGWSPSSNEEIFNLEELINVFDVTRINKAPAIFDIKKLQWINNHYIKKLSIEDLYKITISHLQQAYDLNDKSENWLRELIDIYQEQLSYGAEIVTLTELFFKKDVEIKDEEKVILTANGVANVLKVFSEEITNIIDWDVDNIVEALNKTKEKTGAKGKNLFMPIRIKISGQMHGPELPRTIHLLGKEMVLNRLNK